MSPTSPAQSRPIVGVLVTFSHSNLGKAFLLREGRNYIGSAAGAQVRMEKETIAPKHAVIAGKNGIYYIDDCLSETGTWLNGAPVSEKASLKHNDVIQTGDVLWRFAAISPPDPEFTQT